MSQTDRDSHTQKDILCRERQPERRPKSHPNRDRHRERQRQREKQTDRRTTRKAASQDTKVARDRQNQSEVARIRQT